jgi:NAD(P)-dependent dehydrogenase (short-subunit alcohol dehydrogenase family)
VTPLAGRTAIVTGASSGIGRAITLALAETGADLLLAGRNPERLRDAAAIARHRAPSRDARIVERAADITLDSSVRDLAEQAGALGGAAILVHSSGLYARAPLAEAAVDDLDNEAQVRVLTIHAGRTATPRQARIFAAEGRPYAPERLMQPEDVAAIVLAALLLPRSAEVTSLTLRPMRKP